MKIAESQLQLSAQHSARKERQVEESLSVWMDDSADEGSAGDRGLVLLSSQGKSLAAGNTSASQSIAAAGVSGEDVLQNDPALFFLKKMLEMMTGEEIKVMQFDGASMEQTEFTYQQVSAQGTTSAGFGLAYDYQETYLEAESMDFSASGVIKTSDGKTLAFDLSLSMSRMYTESRSISFRAGDAVRKDPLVINIDRPAAALTPGKFLFDIDNDGEEDNISFVAPGSALLALDSNGDGQINNGAELFGALTGDAFAELARFDEDGNLWIDENDAVYEQLRLWEKDADGNDVLSPLKGRGIGAISLSSVLTPFELKDENNQMHGVVKETGVYLQEDGGVGSVQALDLVV